MIDYIGSLNPLGQALVVTLMTWGMTAIGAALVFTTKSMNQKLMDSMLGFAGGVMIAASFWSLLSPAIEMAEGGIYPAYVLAATGFLLGAVFLWGVDQVLPHLHPNTPLQEAEGINPIKKRRSTLLVLAITIHNIPEGLAIGVAFGALSAGFPSASLTGAAVLALGISIQNIPEGAAVSMPLRREGMSRRRSFFYGQLSGMVEPIAAMIGVLAVTIIHPILPVALSFAAGAMIFVVTEEVIPGSQENGNNDLASMSLMIGFTLMMVLDIALG